MITRCMHRRICTNLFWRWRGNVRAWVVPVPKCRTRHTYATLAGETRDEKVSSRSLRYEVFNRLPYPELNERHNPNVWTALLEPALPAHLQQYRQPETDHDVDAHDLAEILLAAQRLKVPSRGIDLLYQLGIVEGRWSAVVWLVKRLVEAFGDEYIQASGVPRVVSLWRSERSLTDITEYAIDYGEVTTTPPGGAAATNGISQSLEQSTDDSDRRLRRHQTLGRDALGQVWRSLGNMTIACVDGEIKAEILEIIAYLHHVGLMPMSIYNQKPSADVTAIQQPPTLTLFSSRILTSLSDAAWRAHEKLIVEEARAKGAEYASVRPEIPGTAYRVSVGGLRPELWLELILWSCLHGSWAVEGGEVLRTLHLESSDPQWKPMSWRSLVRPDDSGGEDWNKIEYSFNTRAPSTMDLHRFESPVSVRRTISSEVVNAYIDASLSTMRVGVGERGVAPGYVIEQMRILRKFLDRSGLSISSGSWDAIILRFLDSQDHILNHRGQFNDLINLSPVMGEYLESMNRTDLPAYVLDGSAAVLGFHQRALRSRIQAGDVEGAFKLFKSLQERADGNKRQSIVDFLAKQQLFECNSAESSGELFTNNFSGIDYPAFDLQIPATILGPFMDLIIDAKAYAFGKWLLYSADLDGPVIPERMYGEPALAPVLVRFATETSDKNLLSKMVQAYSETARVGEPSLPPNVLQSFFDSQVNLNRWDSAVRILKHMKDISFHWNSVNLAQVVRAMLFHLPKGETRDASYDSDRARALFAEMVSGKYDVPKEFGDRTSEQITVIVTMLSLLSFGWTKYCRQLLFLKGHYTFRLSTKAFNLVLEGIVRAYGGYTGRRILGIFWSHSVRDARRANYRSSRDNIGEKLVTNFRPSLLDQTDRQRTVIRLLARPAYNIVMYGGPQPDINTIRIILHRAIEDFKESKDTENLSTESAHGSSAPAASSSEISSEFETPLRKDIDRTASGTIVWAVHCLQSLQMEYEDILAELRAALTEDEMQKIQEKLSSVSQPAEDAEDDSTFQTSGDHFESSDTGRATYSPFGVQSAA